MGTMTRKPTATMVRLKAFVRDMDNFSVRIGWFSSAKYVDGTPAAYVASIHEFGAPSRGIPARSFIRPTISAKTGDWSQQMRYLSKQIVNGSMNTEQALTHLALVARGDVDATLARIKEPELSPLTIYIRKFVKNGGKIFGYRDVMRLRWQMEKEEKDGTLDLAGVSTDPLDFSGYMRSQLTFTVTQK